MGKTAKHLARTLKKEKRKREAALQRKIKEVRENVERSKIVFLVPVGKAEGNKNPCLIPAHYHEDHKRYTTAKGTVPCAFDLEWNSK